MGDFGIKKRYIVKVKDPAQIKKKIHPEELCINRKTGITHLHPHPQDFLHPEKACVGRVLGRGARVLLEGVGRAPER